MKRTDFVIKSNKKIAKNIYKAELLGDTGDITAPGQFVNILIDGLYLRRPISVCDCEGEKLTVIYKTVGKGTHKLSGMHKGSRLAVLTRLGNGYDLTIA